MTKRMNSQVVDDYRAIKQEYAFDPGPFNGDENRVRRIKEIISTRLSVPDRTLILLYAEYQSYRKLGEQLGLSHMTVRREILRIRKIILDEYGRLDNED